MFRAVHSNPMVGIPAGADVSAMVQPMNQLPGNNAVMQGFPVTLQDGRTVMYCVQATGSPKTVALGTAHQEQQQQQQQQQQAHFIPTPTASAPQGWPQSSTQGSLNLSQLSAENAAGHMWFAANSNGAVGGAAAAANAADMQVGGRVLLQPPLAMTNFSMDKLQGSVTSQPSSQLSYTRNDLSTTRHGAGLTACTNALSNFNVSATSMASSNAMAATGGSVVMGHLTPTSGLTGFQMPVPLPQAHPGAHSQPQTCFLVKRTTDTVATRHLDEMSATSIGPSVSAPSYSMQPPPPPPPAPAMPMSVPSASASVSSAPAFFMTPQMAYGGAAVPAFSASVSGTSALTMPAMLPPAPVKTINGLQYQLGELYEGFVKRYNPNRGFGFLTATTHIAFCREEPSAVAATSVSTPTGFGTEVPAMTMIAVKEVRTDVQVGDIFVHQSYMHMQGFRTLPVGGRVRFRVGYKDGQQTFQAVDVELLPQVLPPNMEVPVFTAVASLTSMGAPAGAGGMLTLPPPSEFLAGAAPPSQVHQTPSDVPSGVASIRSGGRAVNYTPSDDDGDDEDQSVIELAFNMYPNFK